MKEKYKIVLATSNDIKGVCNLIYNRCVWFKENNIFGWDLEYYPNAYNYDYFINELVNNKVYVLKINEIVVGAMVLKTKDLDYWEDTKISYYLHHLVTDINYKGLGELLIEYAIKECKKDGKKYLRLDCYKDSKFLNNYYRRLGFKKVGSENTEYYNYNLWELVI